LPKTGFFAVCTLGLLLVAPAGGTLEGARLLANSAGSWNSHAIESTLQGVRVREIDPTRAEIAFPYDLENKTDNDYQLSKGPAVVIMSRLKSSGSLSSEKQVTLNSGAFVPARNRTRIEIGITQPFRWPSRMDAAGQMRIRELVAGEVTDLEGFALFDQGTRYQIDLPGAWPEIEKAP
jgi:hypothetical protein